MKIQCDVCDKDEASVFCVADEAALCAACDHRVHHANKLAGKHQRFSLHTPSPKQAPLCDICQERKAFLFCQQDRAILCKDCDVSVHKSNEHTKNHTRFLLTGVKLSSTSALYSSSPSSSEAASSALTQNLSDSVSSPNSHFSKRKPVSVSSIPPACSTNLPSKSTIVQSSSVAAAHVSCDKTHTQMLNWSTPTSSISEYLMETLPGWHVEDFLDSSSLPYGFCKNGENDVMSILDADLGSNPNMGALPTEKLGFWVPQMPPSFAQAQQQSYQSMDIAFGAANASGFKEQSKEFTINNMKSSRKWNEDNSFAVPQISTPSSTSKKCRTFW